MPYYLAGKERVVASYAATLWNIENPDVFV